MLSEMNQKRYKALRLLADHIRTPSRDLSLNAIFNDVQDEDLIKKEEMAVTVSHSGYIKRVPLSTYRSQNRGGKGRSGMQTKDEDFVTNIFVANTHQPILFFSSTGMVYKLKTYLLPISSPQAKGKALINLLPLSDDEVITTIMPLSENEDDWKDLFVMFALSLIHI